VWVAPLDAAGMQANRISCARAPPVTAMRASRPMASGWLLSRISPDLLASAGRSVQPRWSHDGHELYFWDSSTRTTLWSVAVSRNSPLSLGEPVKVLSIGSGGTTWDVAPDGRFLVELPPGGEQPGSTLDVVTNWFEELRRLAPARK